MDTPNSQVNRRKDRPQRGQRGGVLIELAISVPVFALLTIGIVDLGRGIWMQSHLGWLARDAARFASVRSPESDDPASQVTIEDFVRSRATALEFDKLTVTANWDPSNTRGGNVRVDVAYDLTLLIGFMPQATILLESSSDRLITY